MGWILGLALVIIIICYWPLPVKLTLKSDPTGNIWNLEVILPWKAYLINNRDGVMVKHYFSRNKKQFQMLKFFPSNDFAAKTKDIPRKDNIWTRAFFNSLKLKKISLKLGLKGSYSGEVIFLCGLLLAVGYPICGYWYFKKHGLWPKVAFDHNLAGFNLNCIITFSLGQLIIEAIKRYQALWKEQKDAG